jgi:hypothetical protein
VQMALWTLSRDMTPTVIRGHLWHHLAQPALHLGLQPTTVSSTQLGDGLLVAATSIQ